MSKILKAAEEARAFVNGEATCRVTFPGEPPREMTLTELLKASVEKVKAMSPEEREAMFEAQRQSWARANVSTGDPRFD